MATLIDTSVLAVLVRGRSGRYERAVRFARDELAAGRGLISVVTVAELLVGARDADGAERLECLLRPVPTAPLDDETGISAGRLGAWARRAGATVPLPDLLIAATAVRLGIPLLAVDSDFARGRETVREGETDHGATLWRALQLHPAGF